MLVKPREVIFFQTSLGKTPAKEWLDQLKDKATLAIIFKRIRQAGLGNFGKFRSLPGGISELKIDHGPGYRIYFGIYRDQLIIILAAGSKRTQPADILKAQAYWNHWKENVNEN